jgi:DNA polymerase-3 subunit epsilon
MFLAAEFHAAGLDVPVDPSLSLCTMRLAQDYLRGTGRSLAACCAAAGVEVGRGHDAMDDAIAAARLLRFYLAQADRPAPWASLARHAAGMPWPKFPDMDVPPRFPAPVPVRRGHRSVEDDAAWLERLVDRLPRVPDPPHADEYLDLLDRELLDRQLSATEKDSLVAVSDLLGLTRDQVLTLHEEYLDGLARIAWADGVVTSEERMDLQQVARLLGLDELVAGRSLAAIAPDRAGPRAPAGADDHKAVFIPHQRDTFALDEGDRVAFTGETMRCREEWTRLLESAGLHAGGVTRSTRLLVAADPDSLSGKARKARDYGIPIVTEQAFLQIFERFVGTGERSHSR